MVRFWLYAEGRAKDLLMESRWGRERNRGVNEDTEVSGLSNRKGRIAIHQHEEHRGRVDLGVGKAQCLNE